MTYIILGAGAVGTALAAELATAGIPARLVARGPQLDRLRRDPLLYRRPEGVEEIRLDVTDSEGLRLAPEDVILLALKTQDVEAVSAELATRPVAGGGVAADLPIVTLQNGLEAERIVARRFARPYAAVVRVPAIYTEVGKVRVLAEPQFASFVVGRAPEGRDGVTARLVPDLTRANALAEERADILRWKAQKLLLNVRNALELFSGPAEAVAEAGEALTREAEEVLTAAGFTPARDEERQVSLDGWRILRDAADPAGQSTWQSFTRGARSEVDFLNGEVVLQARLLGRDAPWNRAAQRLAAELAAQGGAPGGIGIDRLIAQARTDGRAAA